MTAARFTAALVALACLATPARAKTPIDALCRSGCARDRTATHLSMGYDYAGGLGSLGRPRLLYCECTPQHGVARARVESHEHYDCLVRCERDADDEAGRCREDYDRSRCAAATAEAIAACNAGVHETQRACLTLAEYTQAQCARVCESATPPYAQEWPPPICAEGTCETVEEITLP